jgi:ferritin-like metal-binding protein YciE
MSNSKKEEVRMALFSMKIDNLQELFTEQLRDLYDSEQQITEALPKLIEKASNPELKSALKEHLDVTGQQITRLEQIFRGMNEKPTGETCKGMKGLIKEGDDVVSKAKDPAVRDASIIASAQKVEHYEIAGYGTVKTYARQLGKPEYASILDQILSEEKEADETLTQIAETVNIEAKAA